MGDMLSQAEIDALLGNGHSQPEDAGQSAASPAPSLEGVLTAEQKDILGEVGNISMGTAATTLFALLNQKVLITTPRVEVHTWKTLASSYTRPSVGIRVDYKEGIKGSNILILRDNDVKIIANLMMGGDGAVNMDEGLSELDLSAIGEAMNQMVGSSSTSLSSLVSRKIDIDTPTAFILSFADDSFFDNFGFQPDDVIVSVAFRMVIGTLIDSEIMQVIPLEFAQDLVTTMSGSLGLKETPPPKPAAPPPPAAVTQTAPPRSQAPVTSSAAPPPQEYQQATTMSQTISQPYAAPSAYAQQADVNVQPAQFQNFDLGAVLQQKENIGIIMDVPLEVTVELGKTKKKIREILEFTPGTIVELDRLASEPIDVLVNGRFVARGEVVVIDENFAIRIIDIVSVDKRI